MTSKPNNPVSIKVENELDARIVITLEDGKEVYGEIIFEFEANGDEFVAYMLEGDEQLYIQKYDEDGHLTTPEDDEWDEIEKIVEKYANGEDEDEEGDEE